MKFFRRLNSLVELETKRLVQKEATDLSTLATILLLLTELVCINIEFYIKLKYPEIPANSDFADFLMP